MSRLNVHLTKTDNINIDKKVDLRRQATKHLDELNVLDLFAGENIMWSHFNCKKYFGVEKNKGKGKNLNADNNRIIPNLDLSKFNVIDLDSYGMPFEQLDLIFENPTLSNGTVIIFTCITSKSSRVGKRLIKKFSLEEIYKKSKLIISTQARELFYELLRQNGINEVYGYSDNNNFNKDYGYFIYKNN